MKSETSYWIGQTLLAIIRFILHFVMSILRRRKGKKVVPPVNNPLLLKSASTLARDIREGKYKSEDVIQAYIDRIQEVEPYINATAELCFDDALQKARKVDELIASGKYTKEQFSLEKPLLGVPFTVKSTIHVKNLLLTAACHYFSYKVEEDAPVVSAMKKAGAIVIATTNIPELTMHLETYNKYYGTTNNPYDTDRTCGGSSGGEGALISSGGSVLGLGNDLMGSVRIPAHLTGIFAHKPSRGLVSGKKVFPFNKPGSPEEFSPDVYKYFVNGPMCRYAEDLITSMKVLSLDNEVRMKFDRHVDFKAVKVLYLTEIRSPTVVPLEQDIADGLKKAVSFFAKKYDTSPQEVKMPYLFNANKCITNVITPVVSDMKAATIGHKGLGLNSKLEFAKCLFGKSKLCFSTLLNINSVSNPLIYRESETPYSQKMIEKWADEFNNLLDENTILLMPTLPFVAPYHSETLPLILSLCYVSLFNILGLPATHCPLGFTKKGLPYGIQIVGCQNNDPLTIACAVELEKAFGGWKPI